MNIHSCNYTRADTTDKSDITVNIEINVYQFKGFKINFWKTVRIVKKSWSKVVFLNSALASEESQ